MAKRAGRPSPELIQPEIDRQTWYLWRWFCEISMGRQSNGMAANTLSWTEIRSWAELTKREPNEWEVATIRALDWEFIHG